MTAGIGATTALATAYFGYKSGQSKTKVELQRLADTKVQNTHNNEMEDQKIAFEVFRTTISHLRDELKTANEKIDKQTLILNDLVRREDDCERLRTAQDLKLVAQDLRIAEQDLQIKEMQRLVAGKVDK